MKDVTNSALEYAGIAVEIAIGLIGIMALWLGVMKVAEEAGLIRIIANAMKPLTKFLFPDVPQDHPAMGAMIMNMAANMLGLGNAATPFGLKAMDELDKLNPNKGVATNAMCTFLAVNTAGLTLIPATAIAIRAAAGSKLFKSIIQIISTLAIPMLIFIFIGYGAIKKVKIYEVFVEGAKEGFDVAIRIIPYLVAMLVAIGIFRAGGGMDILISALTPFTNFVGMPAEALPMAIMRPLSGSGSLGIMAEIIATHGPDSFIGILVSTFFGSTETTFYVIAVYFGAVNIRKTRHALAAGLLADIAGILGVAEKLLVESGFKVKIFPHDRVIGKEELIKNAKNADAIISLLTEKFDREVIDQLVNCKIIANYAVGFNNIDVEYAKSKGIIVTNTPDVLTDATAEIAVSLILACSRRIVESDNFMRNKKFVGWEPELLKGVQLSGKTFGLIGAGRIGIAVAKRIKSFGCKIIYYNRSKKIEFEKEFGAKKVSLNKLMQTSDIISIHLPLNSKTKLLLDKTKLELLKSTSILVNTARGEIVDEKYLIELLKKKRIFGAGFDVYENEPIVNPNLLKLNNVVLLPHIGSSTNETRDKMAELAAKNVINVLSGKKAITPLN
ncbi:unnamed protein product [Cyprideis torosa]|uniref:Uncharacterized protein n=1 Tax=Cyprideis torosa TaxID=163714 RepID=A0A7R8WQE7_9CRUS|nr:unnamed protein product [Cyprideis torosa]CAG0905967.1 unnamed protein product [Cyprideis torosa]